jgi:hypothetical protein
LSTDFCLIFPAFFVPGGKDAVFSGHSAGWHAFAAPPWALCFAEDFRGRESMAHLSAFGGEAKWPFPTPAASV